MSETTLSTQCTAVLLRRSQSHPGIFVMKLNDLSQPPSGEGDSSVRAGGKAVSLNRLLRDVAEKLLH